MGYCVDGHGEEHCWDDMEISDVWVTDNPVVATLLAADGTVLRQVRERRPIGFR